MFGTNGNGRQPQTLSRFEEDPNSIWDDKLDAVKNSLDSVVRQVGKSIARHPEVSLAAALACGVMVGWLIKRTK